ncbi:uncharacterized protein LOC143344496 [Colletes latitarsis]|uniref:uncharacterized protein LOC143344496 n=1 Tax=Colletes latitarsis TaxID=2605962 RepID=UPI004035D48E
MLRVDSVRPTENSLLIPHSSLCVRSEHRMLTMREHTNFNAKVVMEWSTDTTLLFIQLYKNNTCLWDPNDPNYKLRCVKDNAWKEICSVIKCSIPDAKRKVESLLASFRRERNKEVRTGTYRSSWFAFKSMQFLLNKFPNKSKTTENTVTNEDSHAEDESNVAECTLKIERRTKEDDEIEEIAPPLSTAKMVKRKQFLSPTRMLPKRQKFAHDPQVERAYRIIEDTVSKRTVRDASAIFGEHVAIKHRSYNRHTQNMVEHLISDILFEADMGKYNENPKSNEVNSATAITLSATPSSSSTLETTS